MKERRYNPIGYHLGTIWPHDNSIIAAGMRKYSFTEQFLRVFAGIFEVSLYFQHKQLPENFAGFSRDQYEVPVRYPVAAHPQAWASGALPFLLETALGLVPLGLDRRLRIVNPVLPDFVEHLELRRLRVGSANADLDFDRRSDGTDEVSIREVRQELDITVEAKEKETTQ